MNLTARLVTAAFAVAFFGGCAAPQQDAADVVESAPVAQEWQEAAVFVEEAPSVTFDEHNLTPDGQKGTPHMDGHFNPSTCAGSVTYHWAAGPETSQFTAADAPPFMILGPAVLHEVCTAFEDIVGS